MNTGIEVDRASLEIMCSKAVFLDKDGTLVEDIPYNVDPHRIRLTKGAVEALFSLQERGYLLIVVTNQSGVARGFFTEKKLRGVRNKLEQLLSVGGVSLTDFYYCPHYPDGRIGKYAMECSCRKPQPGMLYKAALEHEISLSDSWMVGDILHDMEAGNRAGCRTILMDNGHETEWNLTDFRQPEFIAKDLESVARLILKESAATLDSKPWHDKISIS